MTETKARVFPRQMPAGHEPVVQRYSARLPEGTRAVHVLCLGYQAAGTDRDGAKQFLTEASQLFATASGPVHHDFSSFVDPEGYATVLAVAYWLEPEVHDAWRSSEVVSGWWSNPSRDAGPGGYFLESMSVSVDHLETIAFKEYVRGLSACPANTISAILESGYWGAARDRIPASAFDALGSAHTAPLAFDLAVESTGRRVTVIPPANMVAIRSGVSWADCGAEQLASYEKNVKPKLDRGMEYLRTHPADSGCFSLRQVDVIDPDGTPRKEGYSLGYFLSLGHLETWSRSHPTHLAIYARAMAERKKYREKLELRTYHEVYVVDGDVRFEYVNCHPRTGLLPFRFSSPAAACPATGATRAPR